VLESRNVGPEQKQLKETACRFAADEIIPVAAKYDEEQTFADDVVRKAWELGLMNFAVPEELGGPSGPAGERVLARSVLHHRAGRGLGRRRHVDHVPARRRRARPERHEALHLERQRGAMVRRIRHPGSEDASRRRG